jgi:hypothetical protein
VDAEGGALLAPATAAAAPTATTTPP